MAATLATLVVQLEVQHAKLAQDLAKANRRLDDFGKSAKKIGKSLAQAFEVGQIKAAASWLTNLALSGAEAGDRLGKLAQAAGVSAESFSRLAYAGRAAGVSNEEMSKSLGRLGERMYEAASGSKAQKQLFESLGVSVVDATGNLRDSAEVFDEVAEKLDEMPDGAKKTALAMDAFGQSGGKLLPVLGSLEKMTKESDRLGATLTDAGAQALGDMADSVGRLSSMYDVLKQRVALGVAPAFTSMANELSAAGDQFRFMDGAVTVLVGTMKLLMSMASTAVFLFQGLGKSIAGVASAMFLLGKGEFRAAKESVSATFEDIWQKDLAAHVNRVEKIWKTPEVAAAPATPRRPTGGGRPSGRVSDVGQRIADAERDAGAALARAERESERREAEIRRSMSRAGVSGPDTRGFASLDAALEEMSLATRQAAKIIGDARLEEMRGHHESAEALTAWAEGTQAIADNAEAAAQAFVQVKESEIRAAQDEFRERQQLLEKQVEAELELIQAKEEARSEFVKDLAMRAAGPAKGIIEAGAKGAQVGGVFGAIVAVLAEFLFGSKQFQAITKAAGAGLQAVSDALGKMLESSAPLVVFIEPLAEVVGLLAEMINTALGPSLWFLFEVSRGITWVVLQVARGIGEIWNGLVATIEAIFRGLAELEILGAKPFGFLKGWADAVGSAKLSMDGLDKAIKKLETTTYDTAKAEVLLGDEAERQLAAQAAADVNVPGDFNRELARFEAGGGGLGFQGPPPPVVEVYVDEEVVTGRVWTRTSGTTSRGGRKHGGGSPSSPSNPRMVAVF